MRQPLATVLVLALAAGALAVGRPGAATAQRHEPGDPPLESPQQLAVFHAVLEGCYHDGVSNEVVDAMVEVDEQFGWPKHFVYACPICTPAFDALRAYRARPGFYNDKMGRTTFGWGLPDTVRVNLLSKDLEVRHVEIQRLVRTWVERYVERMRLTDEETAAWRRAMEELREKGLARLRSYHEQFPGLYSHMSTCPWCDGAAGAMGR